MKVVAASAAEHHSRIRQAHLVPTLPCSRLCRGRRSPGHVRAVPHKAGRRCGALHIRCSASQHNNTSPMVKAIVSGLTSVVNTLGGSSASAALEKEDTRELLTPSDLLAGVEKDFTENGYLWSGEIDANLYCYDCTFTDPTLSFQGLDVFQRNIENLQPWLERLLRNEKCELRAIELDEENQEVRAQWLMAGDVALPWRPRVELTGHTRDVTRLPPFFRQAAHDSYMTQTVAAGLSSILKNGTSLLPRRCGSCSGLLDRQPGHDTAPTAFSSRLFSGNR